MCHVRHSWNKFFQISSIFKSLHNRIELVTRHDTPAYMKDITEVSKDTWKAFFNENSTTIECVQGKNHIFMVWQYTLLYLCAIIIHVSKQLVIKWYVTKFFEIFRHWWRFFILSLLVCPLIFRQQIRDLRLRAVDCIR